MCGIFGYICRGDKTPPHEDLAEIAALAEHRGTDASGLAWWTDDDNSIGVVKAPVRGGVYLTVAQLKSIFPDNLPRLLIGHTRSTTKGDESDNRNNHPVYSKETGTVLVHNGCVSNDDELFDQLKMQRDGQVDTEVILRLWDHQDGDVKDKVEFIGNKLKGSYAVAVLRSSHPGELVLFRHSNPIELYYDHFSKIMWFGSSSEILGPARRQWGPIPWGAIPRSLPAEHWLLIRSSGPSLHDSFLATGDTYQPSTQASPHNHPSPYHYGAMTKTPPTSLVRIDKHHGSEWKYRMVNGQKVACALCKCQFGHMSECKDAPWNAAPRTNTDKQEDSPFTHCPWTNNL